MTKFVLDTAVFEDLSVAEETAVFAAGIEERMNRAPARWETPVEVERALPPGGGVVSAEPAELEPEVRTIAGPGGALPIRIIRPERAPVGVYLHFHGGGFCLGAARNHDAMLAETAARAGVATVSIDYRLAPEHPYPAAPADAEAALLWLVENAAAEFGSAAVVVGGESAGALLSVVAALRLRDRHGFTGLAGLNLSQGGYDLRMTPSLRSWGERRLILNTPTAACHFDRYLQGADPGNPDVSPLFADLRDLPPALFTVGTWDPLLDDNGFMSFRWLAAGNEAHLDIHPGGIHGFTLFDTALARAARTRINSFIARCVADRR